MKMAKTTAQTDAVALAKAIRMCLDSGEVRLGERETQQMARTGKGRLMVVATNAPVESVSDLRRYCSLGNVPLLFFPGTSMELGSVCGKPFPVSMLTVLEVGNSPILGMAKKEKA
jgi:large subunit ribosomal protein L30e